MGNSWSTCVIIRDREVTFRKKSGKKIEKWAEDDIYTSGREISLSRPVGIVEGYRRRAGWHRPRAVSETLRQYYSAMHNILCGRSSWADRGNPPGSSDRRLEYRNSPGNVERIFCFVFENLGTGAVRVYQQPRETKHLSRARSFPIARKYETTVFSGVGKFLVDMCRHPGSSRPPSGKNRMK